MGKFLALDKALRFAARITKAYQYLIKEKKEYRMSDQLYRSGTSIQANLSEAQYATSHADFIYKVHSR